MGDPRAAVPYHDPHDVSSMYTSEQHLLHEFQSEENPTLSDLYYPQLPPDPNPCLPSSSCDYYSGFHQSGKAAASGDHAGNSFNNPAAWSTGFASSSHGYGQGGLSCPGGSNAGAGPSTSTGNMDVGNARPLPLWPVLPAPYSCSCCHVLREIIHMNGNHTTRLELHGRLGIICHAILENQQGDQSTSSGHQYQIFDFCKKSIENVKQFLLQYCEERSLAGYKLIPDPLSMYYEAVCIGLVWDDIIFDGADDFLEPSPRRPVAEEARNRPPEDAPPTNQQSEPAKNDPAGANPRTSLAVQRERTGKLTLRDLAGYFHLPLETAAEKLNLCPTVIKRICRRDGLKRWPHRKIRSLKRQVLKLQPRLASENHGDRQAAQADIATLEQQMSAIRYGVPEAP